MSISKSAILLEKYKKCGVSMKTSSWIFSEWSSMVKNPKVLIPLIGILFVPILYSGTYLWAFWDPYARTEHLPVAVVNEDVAVTYKGKVYSVGGDLVEELKKDHNFQWTFTSKSEAERGLQNDQYFFSIYIPKDFSNRATTLTEEHPTPLELYFQSNVGSNYIASRMGETGIEKIREKLSRTVSENYAKTMFEEIITVGGALQDAGNATVQIRNGLSKVRDGTSQIQEGMMGKKDSIQQLTNATEQMSKAATDLANGSRKLQTKMTDIQDGILSLENGLSAIQTSSGQLEDHVTSLYTGSQKLDEILETFSGNHPELKEDPLLQQMAAINQQLTGGLQEFSTATGQMSGGLTQMRDSTKQLSGGSEIFANQMENLSEGAETIASSQNKITEGTIQLSNGWNTVINSVTPLVKGETELIEGSHTLENQLYAGANEIQTIHSEQPIYEMMSNPVRLKEVLIHNVPNYGTGMSPFFISISLYVGALLLSTVFPLRETKSVPPSAISWFLSKFVVLAIISLGQSLITVFVLVHFVGIEPMNLKSMYLFTFFISLTFMALIQFLVTSGNNVGRFIGVILLVLQLTASSGTFPVELIPPHLQQLHSLLPMSYTVDGLRVVISTGDFSILRSDSLTLLAFLVTSIILTILLFKYFLKRKRVVSVAE
jgi:putative membrane protein